MEQAEKLTKRAKKNGQETGGDLVGGAVPLSAQLAMDGVKTDRDFAACMSAIMGDVARGTLSTERANAMVNAGGKLLKVVEMRLRYGTKEGAEKRLSLVG